MKKKKFKIKASHYYYLVQDRIVSHHRKAAGVRCTDAISSSYLTDNPMHYMH